MAFERILGQPAAVEALQRALEHGLVHHAYRFEGPAGVGKELCAFALAKALVCADRGCGRCDTCRRIDERSAEEPHVPLHPDVVLSARGLYPPQVIGRDRAEVEGLTIEQIRRVVLARAGFPPHEGKAKVFIVRDADELTPGAANALLKTLEEPREGTYFVLLTSRPERLLDTIRSRTLPIRFRPLPDEVVAAILREHGVDDEERLTLACELAEGSASAALEAADPERSSAREAFLREVFAAMSAPDLGKAVLFGETVDRDRRWLGDSLRALGAVFVREARRKVASDPAAAELAARRHALVADAIDAIERNGIASISMMSLIASLRLGHQQRPGTPPPIVITRR